MKVSVTQPPPIQPPKTVTLELTVAEAHILSSMVKCRGYTLKYPEHYYVEYPEYPGPGFTAQELQDFSRAMANFQCQFPGPARLVWNQ